MAPKKAVAKLIGLPWKLSGLWNETLDTPNDRPYIARDYMYASELGGAFCDRYLKMYAVPMTNPPNTRSRRKFQAGSVWEWVFGMILISSGMLKKKQLRVKTKLPRMLEVSGRLDYTVGPPDDWNKAKENVQRICDGLAALDLDIPPFFFRAIDRFIDAYKGKHLMDVVAEVKSLSSFMMEKVQKTKVPLYHHALQEFHYILGNDLGITNGKIFYIGKDDCQLEEFDLQSDDKGLMELYRNDIKLMTKYYNAGFNKKKPMELMPPKEPLVIFEEALYKFSKNWRVEYSSFLTFLYGYATPESYRLAWQSKINAWNRVMKKCILEGTTVYRTYKGEQKPSIVSITPDNRKKIEEAKEYFPQWDKYVSLGKKAGAFKTENIEEEETQ